MFLENGKPIVPHALLSDSAALAKAQREYDEFIDQGSPEARRQAERNRWENVCPGLEYRAADPARLPCPAISRKVLAWQYGRRGLLLHGVTRTGKSMTCWLLLRRLWEEGRTIKAFDGAGWFFAVGAAFREIERAEAWMDKLARVDVLFLDDIFRGNWTGAQDLALWGVMERRVQAHKPIIVTTNATSETLAAKYADQLDPIVARMREFCEDVAFEKGGCK